MFLQIEWMIAVMKKDHPHICFSRLEGHTVGGHSFHVVSKCGRLVQQCLKLIVENRFGGSANKLVDQLSPLEEKYGGNVAHAKLCGHLVVFLHVALSYDNLSIVVLR